MAMFRKQIISLLLLSVCTISSGSTINLEPYSNGAFSVQKPSGWTVHTGGSCTTLAFCFQDPASPLNRMFHFSSVGPFYMSSQQQMIDRMYVQNAGYPIQWLDMPVVNPLTPENFLRQFHIIARSSIARQFMSGIPLLDNLEIISAQPIPSPLSVGNTALIRAVFKENNQAGEGLFVCTVLQNTAFMNGPGGGNAYAWLFSGITAEKNQFAKLISPLNSAMKTYTIPDHYARQCIASLQEQYREIMKAGQTLREASDIIIKGWEARSRTEDVLSEKRSDAILGIERVIDPETGETYHVDYNFWETYKQNRQSFRLNNLEVLQGDGYKQWTQSPRPQRDIN